LEALADLEVVEVGPGVVDDVDGGGVTPGL